MPGIFDPEAHLLRLQRHGDGGLKDLFLRCRRWLKPQGIFVLEPQSWKAYKKVGGVLDRCFGLAELEWESGDRGFSFSSSFFPSDS